MMRLASVSYTHLDNGKRNQKALVKRTQNQVNHQDTDTEDDDCSTCLLYTSYVNLFKDRSFHDCCSFQKADAKVRTCLLYTSIRSSAHMLTQFAGHCLVTLTRSMHMIHGDGKSYGIYLWHYPIIILSHYCEHKAYSKQMCIRDRCGCHVTVVWTIWNSLSARQISCWLSSVMNMPKKVTILSLIHILYIMCPLPSCLSFPLKNML